MATTKTGELMTLREYAEYCRINYDINAKD